MDLQPNDRKIGNGNQPDKQEHSQQSDLKNTQEKEKDFTVVKDANAAGLGALGRSEESLLDNDKDDNSSSSNTTADY